nr:MAG TPA: hypothetical protein [Caudoviricetes sp.]
MAGLEEYSPTKKRGQPKPQKSSNDCNNNTKSKILIQSVMKTESVEVL